LAGKPGVRRGGLRPYGKNDRIMASLDEYNRKRNFRETAEPKGRPGRKGSPIFVVQRHAARRLHFDFRLQVNGALASWAVPKGPPEAIGEKRLAIHVEDHPLDYAKFEGDIPAGNYGAGHVDIWDHGTFEVEGAESAAAQIERGDLKFQLTGQRLNGRFVLVRMKPSATRNTKGNEWLFIRKTDLGMAQGANEPQESEKDLAGVASEPASNPGTLAGARKSAMPTELSVALAQLSDKPFSNPDWLFEIKWDGERSLAFIQDGELELRARSGRNITSEYPELKQVVKQFNARKAVLDGEIVVLDEEGRSNFMRIQSRFGVSNPPLSLQQKSPVTYYAFDLLYCDGYDLRNVALEKRKELLRELLRASTNVRYSDHVVEKGVELMERAKERGLEGIIAKSRDSHYGGKRSADWLKFKIVHDLDVAIGGWTEPRKTRAHFGALLMGLYDGKDLKYIGSVGTGFDEKLLEQTMAKLTKLATSKSPFDTTPKLKEVVHWVKPELVARVKYGQWTTDKMLRQPVFLGFQEDRQASDCRLETEVKESAAKVRKPKETGSESTPVRKNALASETGSTSDSNDLEKALSEGKTESLNVELDGKKISLTHLNKIYFPKPSLRKRDILLYYLRVAPYILPFLKDRPMVLKRYPNGIDGEFFFQKEAPSSRPDWVKTVDIFTKERGRDVPYILANDRVTLLYLVNLGCIDHNPWSSRFDDETHPDYLFFDLDPTDGTSFDVVLKVARAVYKHLEALKVRSFLKTSGASGFHIYVPLERKYTYDEARLFAGAIGQRVRDELPEAVTFERTVSKRRKGTVLIDSVQNARGKPLAAAYSLRPFPGAPVSTPVAAAEIGKKIQPTDFNIATVVTRLKRAGDLWKTFWDSAQTLDEAVDKAT
jgi:bifunctional non-homologous end joining protein LigD